MIDEWEWRPGSFTKNFSWGERGAGLKQLHEMIRVGFGSELVDVPREQFRARVVHLERPDYIALNFFLFNKVVNGIDCLLADELVFQAVTDEHSPRFDKLALLAFNLSYAGRWSGAYDFQSRPALWSYYYLKYRVGQQPHWNTSRVSADDIEEFLRSDSRYKGKTTRKLATNLNYLYAAGRLPEFNQTHVERWWADALFLALDRIIADRQSDGSAVFESQYGALLSQSGFREVAGKWSMEKELAVKHLVTLYSACGAGDRFNDELVKDRTALKLPDVEWLLANDNRPQGTLHLTNARILKSIPRPCAQLAWYAGFDVIDADELAHFDAENFVRRHTRQALENLTKRRIKPVMSSEQLMKLTRET